MALGRSRRQDSQNLLAFLNICSVQMDLFHLWPTLPLPANSRGSHHLCRCLSRNSLTPPFILNTVTCLFSQAVFFLPFFCELMFPHLGIFHWILHKSPVPVLPSCQTASVLFHSPKGKTTVWISRGGHELFHWPEPTSSLLTTISLFILKRIFSVQGVKDFKCRVKAPDSRKLFPHFLHL